MSDNLTESKMSRREMLGRAGKTAAASVALTPLLQSAIVSCATAAEDVAPLNGIAGLDRVAILPGKTYLRGWAGYGNPPTRAGLAVVSNPRRRLSKPAPRRQCLGVRSPVPAP